ncbi:MAG: hypothetical protein JO261_06965 [Alphaproteobacteria bacterium]|nr:hypothetical protein [Alphaproteobacteria bacterium]MBV9693422.1 hypothetical protein [Alphaproteobacteria bacterium]
MTVRICVIGNSHCAALAQAWKDVSPQIAQRFSLTFFASRISHLAHLRPDGWHLRPGTQRLATKFRVSSGGLETVEVDAYDAFVLVGCGLGVDLEQIAAQGTPVSLLRYGRTKVVVSEACFDAAVACYMRSRALFDVLKSLRSVSHKPALIVAAPYLSERVLDIEPFASMAQYRDSAFLATLVARCRRSADAAAAEHGCEVVWQDPVTVAAPGFTRLDYGMDRPREQDEDEGGLADIRHCNPKYGALALTRILARLAALLATSTVHADAL